MTLRRCFLLLSLLGMLWSTAGMAGSFEIKHWVVTLHVNHPTCTFHLNGGEAEAPAPIDLGTFPTSLPKDQILGKVATEVLSVSNCSPGMIGLSATFGTPNDAVPGHPNAFKVTDNSLVNDGLCFFLFDNWIHDANLAPPGKQWPIAYSSSAAGSTTTFYGYFQRCGTGPIQPGTISTTINIATEYN